MPSSRVAQLEDDVILELRLPNRTEEWADTELAKQDQFDDVRRDPSTLELVVTYVIGGNCNAITNARHFLDDVEASLLDCDVDPMSFTLTARSVERRRV
jgi:hypothetical protein